MTPACSWRAPEPHAIAWREWDDQFVVYNHATGNTHQLSAFGGEVLLALLRRPSGIDVPELVREIADRVETAENTDLAAEIERALAELAELRLAACSSA